MNSSKENFNNIKVLIIGSGIIGKFNALELSSQGFTTTIVDDSESGNSSNAALGMLMGEIYQKRHGRSWELRKESIKMWPKWIKKLNQINPKLYIEKPFIQLTTSEKKFEKLKNFATKNSEGNLQLVYKSSEILHSINKIFGTKKFQGLISYKDGRINPKLLLETVDLYLKKNKVNIQKNKVTAIEKKANKWISILNSGDKLLSDILILCNSNDCLKLIAHKNSKIELQPVLGQAIEIHYENSDINFLSLPKNFNIDGRNFIPLTENRIIIGSTDEYNIIPKKEKISELIEFLDETPIWLKKNNIHKKWYGVRSKPRGEPSPILKTLDKGLMICSGFYKNGILLAPACASWISKEIKNHI